MLRVALMTLLILNALHETSSQKQQGRSLRRRPVSFCGQPGASQRRSGGRIVNGEEAKVHEFPWMTKLLFDFSLIGAGSLISDRHILTAAHGLISYDESKLSTNCSWDFTKKKFRVLPIEFFTVELGGHRLTFDLRYRADTLIRRLGKMHLHPLFDIFRANDAIVQINDIALLTLDVPTKFTHAVAPICLPSPDEWILDWSQTTVAGWGTVETLSDVQKEKDPSTTLQKTTLYKASYWYCRTKTRLKDILKPEHCFAPFEREIFCLYATNTDACRGDSGGPVMANINPNHFILAGIISWGLGCNQENTPSANTNVWFYIDWILHNTRDGLFLPRPPSNWVNPSSAADYTSPVEQPSRPRYISPPDQQYHYPSIYSQKQVPYVPKRLAFGFQLPEVCNLPWCLLPIRTQQVFPYR